MAIAFPTSLQKVFLNIEQSLSPIDEQEVEQIVDVSFRCDDVTGGERDAVRAETRAFSFQKAWQYGSRLQCSYFGPAFCLTSTNGEERYSPDMAGISADVLGYWSERAMTARHPVLKARYADLVWDLSECAISSKADVEWARIAVDAYSQTISSALYRNHQQATDYGDRALELALKLNDKERVGGVRDVIFILADQLFESQPIEIPIFVFKRLFGHRRIRLSLAQQERVIGALENALRSTSQEGNFFNPNSANEVANLLSKHYRGIDGEGDANRVLSAAAQAFEFAASQGSAIAGLSWIEEAYRLYRSAHRTADCARILVLLKECGRCAEAEMQERSFAISVERETFDAFYEKLLSGSTSEVLMRIATRFTPLRDGGVGFSSTTTLRALCTQVRLSDGNIVARVESSPENLRSQNRLSLADQIAEETFSLSEALRRLRERGHGSTEEVLRFLAESPVFKDERVVIVEHAVDAYFRDDFITMAHVVVPQIEHCLRLFAAILGLPTNKINNRDGTTQEKNLNDLLCEPAVIGKLGPNVCDYLRVLLADPSGQNLRNRISHGLLSPAEFDRGLCDRLFHCLLVLGLIDLESNGQSIDLGSDAGNSDLADSNG